MESILKRSNEAAFQVSNYEVFQPRSKYFINSLEVSNIY